MSEYVLRHPFAAGLDEKAKDKMLLFLPVVGLEIGALWAILAWLCKLLNLPALVAGVILCAYPYMVTGFLHLDGFMDVTDAVKSCRDLQRRREILKDSHVGSFAVIGVVLLMIAQFALLSSGPTDANFLILIFIPAVSRCCSALAVTGLKPISTSQYADQKKPKSHMIALSINGLRFATRIIARFRALIRIRIVPAICICPRLMRTISMAMILLIPTAPSIPWVLPCSSPPIIPTQAL